MADRSLSLWIALVGGLGRSRFAPGTVATVCAGVPCAFLMGLLPTAVAAVLLLAVIGVSCYTAEQAERAFDVHDPQEIVVDELAGFLLTMIGLPTSAKSLLLGVLAFRLFDIWKPWPISAFHVRVRGGVGIVLDDLGAGIYAHLLTWLILYKWP